MSVIADRQALVAQQLRIVCIVAFLDEERHLPRFLDSLARQERSPDHVLLVDDGSRDESARIAAAFADRRSNVQFLQRPARPPAGDRLAGAPELQAFKWAFTRVSAPWDVVVKLDADLVLSPDLFATMEDAFMRDPRLGIAGTFLSTVDPGTGEQRRERSPAYHARGPTKFYRRECFEQIELGEILGWDTIDEVDARRRGWRTASVPCASGDTIHLRPTGDHDGRLRAQFRWGTCAYAIGDHPVWVAASAVRRLADHPRLLGSAAYLAGWLTSPLRGTPRAPSDLRTFVRREQVRALGEVTARAARRAAAIT